MKILWVNCRKLLPLDTGGKIRTYHILRYLSSYHDVKVLSYYGGRRDEVYEQKLVRQFPKSMVLCTGGPDGGFFEPIIDYVRKLPSAAPYSVTKFAAPQVQQILNAWIGDRRFDVAVCDFLCVSINFPSALPTPTVLFQHNVETALWRRQTRWEPNPFRRLVFGFEAAKVQSYEASALKRFHHVIAVSEYDRDQMASVVDRSRISVVPTGVDLEQYRLAIASPSLKPLVMFIGSMDWEANIDGAEHFCREIWPHVQASVPDARLRIVGRDPHTRVLRLVSDSVEVTGSVPSVIEHLQEASVVVVPLRIGGGTRLKIYEAMAMGKAVVSTSVGAEGLDVHHGRDILLADDPVKFAESVTTLLCNHQFRRQLEMGAADLAAQYDWSVVAERFAKVLAQVVAV